VELFEESEKVSGVQLKEIVMNAIRYFQSCSVLIIENALFSSNEELTDYSSNSLKYLSVPFYLGELYRRIPYTVSQDRLNALKQSKSYKEKFISTCIRLGILSNSYIDAYQNETTANAENKREGKKLDVFAEKKILTNYYKIFFKKNLKRESMKNMKMILISKEKHLSLSWKINLLKP
jgi:hypothetical protein